MRSSTLSLLTERSFFQYTFALYFALGKLRYISSMRASGAKKITFSEPSK